MGKSSLSHFDGHPAIFVRGIHFSEGSGICQRDTNAGRTYPAKESNDSDIVSCSLRCDGSPCRRNPGFFRIDNTIGSACSNSDICRRCHYKYHE